MTENILAAIARRCLRQGWSSEPAQSEMKLITNKVSARLVDPAAIPDRLDARPVEPRQEYQASTTDMSEQNEAPKLVREQLAELRRTA